MRYKILILFLFTPLFLFSQQIRINGMGNLFLVTDDEDNELNLYNYGKNSAFLINDESRDWLKARMTADNGIGSLHRLYDPRAFNFYSINFEGVKIIDENQTFKGTIGYLDFNKKEVYRSVQTDIYGKDPYYLLDSVTGSIKNTSPYVSFEYSANLFSGLTIGSRLDYAAWHGLKNLGTKPEMTNRYISGQVGLAYAINENFILGIKIDPYFNYEKTEFVKDYETGMDPTVSRFRGFHIFRDLSNDFTVYKKYYGINADLQISYISFDSTTKIFASAGYSSQNLFTLYKVVSYYDEGYWQENGYNFSVHLRYIPEFLMKNTVLGLSVDWSDKKSWAKHPDLPIVFSDAEQTILNIGAGVSYYFEDLKLRCGVEYHRLNLDTTLNDYLGGEKFMESLPQNSINIGFEHHTFENIFFRLGFIYNTEVYKHTLFIPDRNPAEVKQNRNTFTFGAAYTIPGFVRIDIMGLYGRNTSGEFKDIDYRSAKVILMTKFYVY